MLALFFEWFTWRNPLLLVFGLFALWMLVDALRRGEWLWALFIFLFAPLNAPLYFFLVYRAAARPGPAFELPGVRTRERIKELQDRIHHLDNARDHADLGDVYFQQGKLALAEASYRAALQRDPEDLDTRAHLGQCLLLQDRTPEALPWLEQVCAADAEHDFGLTLVALAECYGRLGRVAEAQTALRRVLERHTYARARVQLAEIYQQQGQPELARTELQEVLSDDAHAPAFQRRRERVWVTKAKALLRQLPG